MAFRVVTGSGEISRDASVLVVCGGSGGEGTFFANRGFGDVTVSDLGDSGLARCKNQDPRLQTLRLNAEALALRDSAYDIVIVQDGLHHLARPQLGLTEMLRVARKAVIVIEPHYGLVGRLFGTEFEHEDGVTNYVFRWSRQTFGQTVLSFLPTSRPTVKVLRCWDHNLAMFKLTRRLPESTRVPVARTIYALLRPLSRLGNMFVGIVLKDSKR